MTAMRTLLMVAVPLMLVTSLRLAAADGGYVSASDAPKCITAAPGFRDMLMSKGPKFGCYTFSEKDHWLQLCPSFPFVVLGADTREGCEAFRAVAKQAGLFGSDSRRP